ncbi:MAG: glycoside hydrolase [Candidatus Hydrogenedentes bacterium]|nr:glycoside hydrolase [Candidatus Hydrogenedentota bacterium]
MVINNPGPEYGGDTRPFQGIPGIERAANGRLWATWYGGGPTEGPENYCMLATSDDDGKTWSDVVLVVDVPGPVRTFDPCLWHDPEGTLWFFWAQGYTHWDGRAGVWAIATQNSGDAEPTWSEPRRICDGIMMNKPTVLSTGDWLLPVSIWASQPNVADPAHAHPIEATTGSHVYASTDRGQTWSLRGTSDVPERSCDEHMLVEKKDGTLWKLVRTQYGVGEAVSTDAGATWDVKGPSASVPHIPHARFFIRRLKSGKLLLVRHNSPELKKRTHLSAYLSDDDGQTWNGGLVLDARDCSYPDGVQAPDGSIYIIYDHERKGAKQILMAVFTEEDILAGEPVSDTARMQVVVNQASG